MQENNLSQISLFRGMSPDEIREALDFLDAKARLYDKNQILFAEGDPAVRAGIVVSGAVFVMKEDFYGNRTIQATLSAPDLFAEVFSCGETERIPVTVLAAERSEVLLIDCRRILSSRPDASPLRSRLTANMVRLLAEKNLLLQDKMDIITRRTTREKLMAYLSSVAKRRRTNAFTIPMNRQQLADYLGVDRSALSSEIGKLCREGVIRADRSRFVILGNRNCP